MTTATETGSTEADLVAQVVAWHNRHPLARRIGPSQVRGVGVVVLPFTAAAAGRAPQPLFCEPFLPRLRTAAIAAFAARHGSLSDPGRAGWPRREIAIDPASPDLPSIPRHLRSAAIEVDGKRSRVLIGDGNRPRILGQRLLGRQRLAAVAAAAAGLAVAAPMHGLGVPLLPGLAAAPQTVALAPTQPAPPLQPSVDATPAASPVAVGMAAEPGAPAPGSLDSALSVDAAAVVEPVPVVSAPAESDSAHDDPPAAAAATAAADEAEPAPAAAARLPAAADGIAAADAAPDIAYALATATTASRVASELRLSFIGLPDAADDGKPRAELMRSNGRWRVVIWPIDSRGAALALRESLARQGVKTELIAF